MSDRAAIFLRRRMFLAAAMAATGCEGSREEPPHPCLSAPQVCLSAPLIPCLSPPPPQQQCSNTVDGFFFAGEAVALDDAAKARVATVANDVLQHQAQIQVRAEVLVGQGEIPSEQPSRARAEAVIAALVAAGVPQTRLVFGGTTGWLSAEAWAGAPEPKNALARPSGYVRLVC